MSVLEQADLYSRIDTAIRDYVRDTFGQSELDDPSWHIPNLVSAVMAIVGSSAEYESLLVKSNYHLINLLDQVEKLTLEQDDTVQNYLLNNNEEYASAFAFQQVLDTELED